MEPLVRTSGPELNTNGSPTQVEAQNASTGSGLQGGLLGYGAGGAPPGGAGGAGGVDPGKGPIDTRNPDQSALFSVGPQAKGRTVSALPLGLSGIPLNDPTDAPANEENGPKDPTSQQDPAAIPLLTSTTSIGGTPPLGNTGGAPLGGELGTKVTSTLPASSTSQSKGGPTDASPTDESMGNTEGVLSSSGFPGGLDLPKAKEGGDPLKGGAPVVPETVGAGTTFKQAGPVVIPALMLPTPKVDPPTDKRLLKKTGKNAEGHHAALRRRVDQLLARALGLQETLRTSADQLGGNAGGWFANQKGVLGARTGQAVAAVDAHFNQAKASVQAEAAEARASIDAGEQAARAMLAESRMRNAARISELVAAQKALYGGVEAKSFRPISGLLEQESQQGNSEAKALASQLEKTNLAKGLADGDGRMDRYLNSVRVAFATPKLSEAVAAMNRAGETWTQDVAGQKGGIKAQLHAIFSAMNSQLRGLEANGTAQLDAAQGSAEQVLADNLNFARGMVDQAEATSLARLEAQQEHIKTELMETQRVIEASMDARLDWVVSLLRAAGQDLEARLGQLFEQAGGQIPTGLLTEEALLPFLDAVEAQLQAMASLQGPAFQQLLAATLMEMLGGVDQSLGGIAAIETGAHAAVDAELAQLRTGFVELGGHFEQGIASLGPAVDQTVAAWVEPVPARLAEQASAAQSGGQRLLSSVSAQLKASHAQWLAGLEHNVAHFLDAIRGPAEQATRGPQVKTEERARKCRDAMRGMGTDEAALFGALRAMAPLEPDATREEFGKITNNGDLDTWIREEFVNVWETDLAGLNVAQSHLAREQGAAARAEISYYSPWYGADGAQIEAVLRGMPEDEREKIAKDPLWDDTKALVRAKLQGPNLDVAEAFFVNKPLRADAIRLREAIDKARFERNDDAVHDALEGVDPKDLPEVAAEFAELEGVRKAIADVEPVDAAAQSVLASYATRDLTELSVPTVGTFGGVQDKASQDLTRALATKGRDDVSVRVARFEREIQRPGGPDAVRLEKAIMVGPGEEVDGMDLKTRLHSPDPEVRAAAELDRDRQQAAFREAYAASHEGKEVADVLVGEKDLDGTKKGMYQSMLEDGFNSPRVAAQQIKLAVTGCGTDEAAIKRSLQGMSPADIARLKTEYRQLPGGDDLETDLGLTAESGYWTELSGRDLQEVQVLLIGDEVHLNDEERAKLAETKVMQQIGGGNGVGLGLMNNTVEGESLAANYKALQDFRAAHAGEFSGGKFVGTQGDYREYLALCRRAGVAAELYQNQADRLANYGTTGLAVVGALVATVATAGAATPLLAGVIGGSVTAATGLASIYVNATLKGGGYGWEQGLTDLGRTGLESLTAGLGAGFGRSLEMGKQTIQNGVSTWTALNPAERMRAMVQNNMLTGAISGTGNRLLDEGTWADTDAWGATGRVLMGGLQGAATGAAGGYFQAKAANYSANIKALKAQAALQSGVEVPSFGRQALQHFGYGFGEGSTTGALSTLLDRDTWANNDPTRTVGTDLLWNTMGGGLAKGTSSATKSFAGNYGDTWDGEVETGKRTLKNANFNKALMAGGTGFINDFTSTAATRDTWKEGVSSGMLASLKSGTLGASGGFAGTTLSNGVAGQPQVKALLDAKDRTRGYASAVTGAADGFGSTAAKFLTNAAWGEHKNTQTSFLEQVLSGAQTAGLEGLHSGIAEGAAEGRKARNTPPATQTQGPSTNPLVPQTQQNVNTPPALLQPSPNLLQMQQNPNPQIHPPNPQVIPQSQQNQGLLPSGLPTTQQVPPQTQQNANNPVNSVDVSLLQQSLTTSVNQLHTLAQTIDVSLGGSKNVPLVDPNRIQTPDALAQKIAEIVTPFQTAKDKADAQILQNKGTPPVISRDPQDLLAVDQSQKPPPTVDVSESPPPTVDVSKRPPPTVDVRK